MTQTEKDLEAIDEALEKASRIPPREFAKRLIEHGLVDKNGKLLRPRKARKGGRAAIKRRALKVKKTRRS